MLKNKPRFIKIRKGVVIMHKKLFFLLFIAFSFAPILGTTSNEFEKKSLEEIIAKLPSTYEEHDRLRKRLSLPPCTQAQLSHYPKTITYDELLQQKQNARTSFNFFSDSCVLTLSYNSDNPLWKATPRYTKYKNSWLRYEFSHPVPDSLTPAEKKFLLPFPRKETEKPEECHFFYSGVSFWHGMMSPANSYELGLYSIFKPMLNTDAHWKSYLFAQKRRTFPQQQVPQFMMCEQFVKYLRSHNVIFYTGAGISMAANILDMAQLEQAIGFDKKDAEKTTTFVVKNKEKICKTFGNFCKSMFLTPATRAHYALATIAKKMRAPIITENVDYLHEQSGIKAHRLGNVEASKKEFSIDFLQKIDAIICVGLSHDDRAFLQRYKEINPQGVLIAIDLKQPAYIGAEDFLIPEDLQDFLVRTEQKILNSDIAQRIYDGAYTFVHTFKRMLEQMFLAKDNFYSVNEEGGLNQPVKGVYRSRQLTPKALKRYIETYGIKTVLNLKGDAFGKEWWENERSVVEKHGVNWVNIAMDGHKYPTLQQFCRLMTTFRDGPFPILIHCEAGADRTGEAAALWVLLHNKKTPHKKRVREALKQLAAKYKHFYFLHPKKDIFVQKFGTTYLWLLAILETFGKKLNNLTVEQVDALKNIAPEPKFFEHVLQAIHINENQCTKKFLDSIIDMHRIYMEYD